jgi:hypothetical protein
MNTKAPLSLLALILLSQLSTAQQPSMSASTVLGPGNSFTLFMNFEEPMPKITRVDCTFSLVGVPQSGQETFTQGVYCSNGDIKKIDEKHYSVGVPVPSNGIAAGDYKLGFIEVYIGDAHQRYQGSTLPDLAPVKISNSEHLKFSPIKKLETKP